MNQIAFITDLHLDEAFPLENNVNPKVQFEIILNDIKNRGIKEIVFGGDIGETTSHQYFFEKLQSFSVNLILGNHDRYEHVKKYFKKSDSNEELFYKSEDHNYQYIYLDSSLDEISKKQLNWLQGALREHKELILYVHHPILSIAAPVDKIYPLKNRNELLNILSNFGNGVTIFCGHYHMNDVQVYGHIKQYVTQSMCFQLVKNATEIKVDNKSFGYRIIKILEHEIVSEVILFSI